MSFFPFSNQIPPWNHYRCASAAAIWITGMKFNHLKIFKYSNHIWFSVCSNVEVAFNASDAVFQRSNDETAAFSSATRSADGGRWVVHQSLIFCLLAFLSSSIWSILLSRRSFEATHTHFPDPISQCVLGEIDVWNLPVSNALMMHPAAAVSWRNSNRARYYVSLISGFFFVLFLYSRRGKWHAVADVFFFNLGLCRGP